MLAAGWAEPPRTPPGCKLLSRRAWFWFEFFNFDLCFRTSSHHFWEKMPSLLRITLRTRIRNYFQKLIFQKFYNCHVSATSVPRGPIRWWHVSFFATCHLFATCHADKALKRCRPISDRHVALGLLSPLIVLHYAGYATCRNVSVFHFTFQILNFRVFVNEFCRMVFIQRNFPRRILWLGFLHIMLNLPLVGAVGSECLRLPLRFRNMLTQFVTRIFVSEHADSVCD